MTQTAESPVLVVRDEHVLLVTLNRPEARNAVNGPLTLGVGTAFDEADRDPDIRAVTRYRGERAGKGAVPPLVGVPDDARVPGPTTGRGRRDTFTRSRPFI